MNTIIRVIGKIFDKANILFCRYKSLEMNLLIGGGVIEILPIRMW